MVRGQANRQPVAHLVIVMAGHQREDFVAAETAVAVVTAAALWAGGRMVIADELPMADLAGFIVYLFMLTWPIAGCIHHVQYRWQLSKLSNVNSAWHYPKMFYWNL